MAEKKKTTWLKVRKFFNDIHLWVGLISGLVVIAICFSGTVYVFNTEIKEMTSPDVYKVTRIQDATPLTPDEIIDTIEKTTGGKVVSLKVYDDPTHAWQVAVRKKEEKKSENKTNEEKKPETKRREAGEEKTDDKKRKNEADDKSEKRDTAGRENKKTQDTPRPGPEGGNARPDMYLVDPYTGAIKGSASEKNAATEFMSTMFSLHRWLLLDKIEEPLVGELPNRKLGSYISGTATILFTLGLLTGLVIWFPQKVKSWKQGLKVRLDANWKRINHDLHNSLAFYSFIFLLLMGITGPQWSFPWYREGLQKSLGTYQPQDAPRPEAPKSTLPIVTEGAILPTLKIQEYVSAANKVFPYKGNYTVTLAADSLAAVAITKNRVGFFAPAAGDKILLDQYTAEVLTVDVFRDKPFNQRVASSIKALHVGDVYGTFSKVLYFLACLIATTLPVTGTIIWINKLRKKKKQKHKKEESRAKKLVQSVV